MAPPASHSLVRTGLSVLGSPCDPMLGSPRGSVALDETRAPSRVSRGAEAPATTLERLLEDGVSAAEASPLVQPSASKRQRCEELCVSPRQGGPAKLRIFALRHQLRDQQDASFTSPLLPAGVREAEASTRKLLRAAAPTQLYSSPFLRCLETLDPYVRRHGVGPVRVEYSLWEHNLDRKVKDEVNAEEGQPVPPAWQGRFSLDDDYASFLPRHVVPSQNRTLEDVHRRTRAFLEHLCTVHCGEPNVVVLCTHQTVVHSLLHQATGIPMRDLNVKMGELVEIEWRMVTGMKW